MLPTPDAVEHRREHQYELHVVRQHLGVTLLRRNEVHLGFWQRPIITDAAGQYVFHAV
jgi:hypothetical protein